MTKPNKTPRQQAEEHWDWIEQLLATQRLIERQLFIEGFVHGYKHKDKERKAK
jgi:hypothetical protein